MEVTYYGHSCFCVQTEGKSLLFDPFISPNSLASSVKIEDIKADYILLSHAHFDHVADTYDIARRTGAMLIANYEICMYYAKKGIKAFHPMNTGGKVQLETNDTKTSSAQVPQLTIKSIPAVHSSSFEDGTYGGLAGGFVISSTEGSFYYAGDTAFYSDMKLIGEEHKLNFALLPVGDNFTMGAEDAVKASQYIGCSNIIGMHYNTFDLIKIDIPEVMGIFEKAGKKITFLNIGETGNF